jgi:hypothetical protein
MNVHEIHTWDVPTIGGRTWYRVTRVILWSRCRTLVRRYPDVSLRHRTAVQVSLSLP